MSLTLKSPAAAPGKLDQTSEGDAAWAFGSGRCLTETMPRAGRDRTGALRHDRRRRHGTQGLAAASLHPKSLLLYLPVRLLETAWLLANITRPMARMLQITTWMPRHQTGLDVRAVLLEHVDMRVRRLPNNAVLADEGGHGSSERPGAGSRAAVSEPEGAVVQLAATADNRISGGGRVRTS